MHITHVCQHFQIIIFYVIQVSSDLSECCAQMLEHDEMKQMERGGVDSIRGRVKVSRAGGRQTIALEEGEERQSGRAYPLEGG